MGAEWAVAGWGGGWDTWLCTAVETTGGVSRLAGRESVDAADMLLLDMKAANDPWFSILTGRGMDNTLDILQHCETTRKPVWIRHVLVPGYTLTEPHLHELGRLLRDFACIERVELLPFHKMGEYKWEALGCPYTLTDTQPPEAAEVARAQEILTSYGLSVR